MAMRNWITPAGTGPSGTVDEGRRAKLPQANIPVANRTSHGTIRANATTGVASSRMAPSAPPTRLIANSARKESCGAPLAKLRAASPDVTWPGNSATVDVMLAARGSSPARTRAGRVTNDPPPASAFCAPAQSPARKSRKNIAEQCVMCCRGKRRRGGTVNLIGSGHNKAQEARSHEGLCPSGHAGDLGPGLEGLGPGGSVLAGGEVIAAEVEEVVDLIVSGEKPLGLTG